MTRGWLAVSWAPACPIDPVGWWVSTRSMVGGCPGRQPGAGQPDQATERGQKMGIGASIFLIVVGAILTFGITGDNIWWLDLDAVGWVLISAGLFGLLLAWWSWRSRRRRTPTPLDDDRGMYPEERGGKFTEEHRTEVHPPERKY